ncbi:MAG: DUF1501 domain-containing protein [Planctomycetes bacterium]|nr:DUF1501 domain-containing protein [Planctomycetota bacterium]
MQAQGGDAGQRSSGESRLNGLGAALSGGLSRRELLRRTGCGFGMLALAGLCADEAEAAAVNPLAPKAPHHPPRASRVIFIFMQGGPSHVDTYDYKPRLAQDDGRNVDFRNARAMKVQPERVFKSPWKFARHGECGQWVSELFPHMARYVDDYCVIRSMHTTGVAHGPATLFMHTGATNLIRPSVGSWVSYGLGTENRNLPAFVTVNPPSTKGGPRNYSNAFLPTVHQGTAIGRAGVPLQEAGIRYVQNDQYTPVERRRQFEFLQALNRVQADRHAAGDELEATIQSYELAWRMQMHAPGVLDVGGETSETQALYGIGDKPTDQFGRQCLMARRLAEAGVRYIQINYADASNTPMWDQHSNLKQHEVHSLATDKPVAGLLEDLKRRGLLDDTLVWWGGEFGRTPFAQGKDGRDHNPDGFTIWLAGGGVKRGIAYGNTDEFGHQAVENKIHMHDLHATILHLLGLDHQRLTYRYAGRDFRLTDVHGRVVDGLFA